MTPTRFRALVGVALAQLRHDRGRTVLAIFGVVLAVLATTLLASVGMGVVATGEEMMASADRDVWVSGGPIRLQPGSVGGFQNTLVDTHDVAADLEARDEVRVAIPMGFQSVYVSPDGEEFDTIVGTGTPATGGQMTLSEGDPLPPETHYANGSYDGNMTHAIIVDPRTAEKYSLDVGDTLHVGGTLSAAREHEFTVVGVSPTFSRFLGVPTLTMHLSELQTVTRSTTMDSATLVMVTVEDDADAAAVARDIETAYPEYDARTNREQLLAIFGQQAAMIASGASLVVLSIAAGVALTLNLLLSMVYSRRRELAAVRALGGSVTTIGALVATQAIVIGLVGGAIGVVLTLPLAGAIDYLAATLVGFDGLVRPSSRILVGGFAIAAGVSLLAAVTAVWRFTRIDILEQLSA